MRWAFLLAFFYIGLLNPLAAKALPLDRAYELVTPGDTGSVAPSAIPLGTTDGIDCFETTLATADGNTVAFAALNGTLTGLTGNGLLNLYEAHRTSTGWQTVSESASGTQTTHPSGGLCVSPDHQYSTLFTGEAPLDAGTLPWSGKRTSYVRYPDDSYHLIASGSLGVDPKANVKWIAAGASHVIFTADKRLEPAAPVGVGSLFGYSAENPPVGAIYDRTPTGLQVLSLLPGGSAPNYQTESTLYLGSSRDGTGAAFEVVKSGAASIYLRRNNNTTQLVVSGAASGQYRFAGISADGTKVAYIESEGSPEGAERGNVFLYDAITNSTAPIATDGAAAVVNISEDGSHVYFMSRHALTGAEENSAGATAKEGEPNLYVWADATESIRFIAPLAEEDVVSGAFISLTNWVPRVVFPQQNALKGPLNDPSRTTPDGDFIVFESRADVTGYDAGGHTQIYRYGASTGVIDCVSCPPLGQAATSDSVLVRTGFLSQVHSLARIQSISDNGSRVFFHTQEKLVDGDENEVADVYEWEAGSISLISAGIGSSPSSLYAMSANGDDVFFTTTDRLVPQDESSVVSIYDARVNGGFPAPPAPVACEGEECRGPGTSSPGLVPPATRSFCGPSNPKVARKKVRHHGKKRRHRKQRRLRRLSGCEVAASR